MKIAITGANGYIARELIEHFENSGDLIRRISRQTLYNTVALEVELSAVDLVIHLAGAPILQRWTSENKAEIMKSRVESTQNLVRVINKLNRTERPKAVIFASAVGIYSQNQLHAETSCNFADDFVGQVVQAWERSSDELEDSVRKIIFRMGVVIGKESQTIRKMLPVFRVGLGGKIGTGNQPFALIHIDDVVGAISWSVQNENVRGVYNLVIPEGTTNRKFTNEFALQLHRPAFFSVPGLVLKIIYGKAATLLLHGQAVYPARLLDEGYTFRYPDLKSCLNQVLS
jgi:uncharacterized protein (TIGR01777 family)